MKLGILRDSICHKWGDTNNYALQKRAENSIIAARATIIQRRYDSTKIFPVSLIERVKCVDLVIVSEDECPCGCNNIKSLRTSNKVPKPLIVKDDSYFNFVGRGYTSFSYCPFQNVQDIPNRKFSANDIYYTYLDGYIYLINSVQKELDLAYVPENLIEFIKFGQAKVSNCIQQDGIYIEDTLIEGIEALLETRKPAILAGKEDAEVEIND